MKRDVGDFPGDPVVKNLPSNAGDVGLISGRGAKIPHAVEQLSLRDTTTEPTALQLECRIKRSGVIQQRPHMTHLRPDTSKT